MCLFPKLIKNKKYTITKKNGGNVPILKDERIAIVPVGCGKCIECSKQRARNWNIRLQEDIKLHKEAKFVTLTFNDKYYKQLREQIEYKGTDEYIKENEIATLAVRRYLERIRKETSKSVRHWLTTELGETNTERLHLHGIIYANSDLIKKHWKYGYIHIGTYVNEQTISYICKYLHKTTLKHKEYKPIVLTSKGIGSNYLQTYNATLNKYRYDKTNETYKFRNGNISSLPKYFRNKLYTENEKEELWINLLSKNIRYVLGQKIENVQTQEGINEYYTALKLAQLKNNRLGYGNDTKNWERKKYENDRRKHLKEKYLYLPVPKR